MKVRKVLKLLRTKYPNIIFITRSCGDCRQIIARRQFAKDFGSMRFGIVNKDSPLSTYDKDGDIDVRELHPNTEFTIF